MKLKELGRTPISDDAPTGQDVKYEPEFEQLQQEIDKLSIASTEGAGIDWKKVTQLASAILSKKSKDLLVASYLSIALIQTHEFEGFVAGITVLDDLVATFWDTLFPPKKRMRGRLNAISWWNDRAKDFLQKYAPSAPLPEETVEALKHSISQLDQNLAEKTSDAAPALIELLHAVDRLPVQQPEPEPEPEPEPAVSSEASAQPEPPAEETPPPAAQQADATPPPPTPAAPAAVSPASGTPEEADRVLKNAANSLLTVADFKLKTNPSDPVPYQILRAGAWSTLTRCPPAQNGQTLIPPPESVLTESFQNMLNAGNFENLIIASEERIPQYKFWLDLNRLTARALEALGASYASALDTVRAETLLFVRRLQGIEELAFSDGTPFADQETKAWLKTIGIGQAAAGPADGESGTGARIAEALANAQKFLHDKKALDGIQLLEEGFQHAASGKDRMLWGLALCRFFLQMGKADLAVPLVEQCIGDADAYRLEIWDAQLCVECFSTAYDVFSGSPQENAQARALEILQRITRLSPAKALHIAGTN